MGKTVKVYLPGGIELTPELREAERARMKAERAREEIRAAARAKAAQARRRAEQERVRRRTREWNERAERRARVNKVLQKRALREAVPDGWYAVDGAEQTEFHKVTTRDGWVGVGRAVGGRTDHGKPRVDELTLALAVGVLRRIRAAGPEAAMRRFGREIGRCGRCGAWLTDETSRTAGLGPDCRRLVEVQHSDRTIDETGAS